MPRRQPDPRDIALLAENLGRFFKKNPSVTHVAFARRALTTKETISRYIGGTGGMPSYAGQKNVAEAAGWTAAELMTKGVDVKDMSKAYAEAPVPIEEFSADIQFAFKRNPDGSPPTKEQIIAALRSNPMDALHETHAAKRSHPKLPTARKRKS